MPQGVFLQTLSKRSISWKMLSSHPSVQVNFFFPESVLEIHTDFRLAGTCPASV